MRYAMLITGFAAMFGLGFFLARIRPPSPEERLPNTQSDNHPPAPQIVKLEQSYAIPKNEKQQQDQIAPEPRPAKPATECFTLPWTAIYRITPEIGINEIPEPDDEKWRDVIAKLRNRLQATGLTSAFLVSIPDKNRIPDIHYAMGETLQVFESQRWSDVVYLGDKFGVSRTPWIFVLIKSAYSDRNIELSSIIVNKNEISVYIKYEELAPKFIRGNMRYYAFWGKLPKVNSMEPYILHIYDGLTTQPLLTRRIIRSN